MPAASSAAEARSRRSRTFSTALTIRSSVKESNGSIIGGCLRIKAADRGVSESTLMPRRRFVKVGAGPAKGRFRPPRADMDELPTGDPTPDSPEAILDALRAHREWGEDVQEAQLARLVER